MERQSATDLGLSEFNTVEEVAVILRVKPTTVRAWIREGRIRAVRLGRRYRIARSEIGRVLKDWATE